MTEKVVFIPNAIEPYGFEIVNILAYPDGFKYRFRFDEEWVHDKVKYNPEELIGKTGYIILRDKDNAKFYPVRNCTVLSARKIGSTFYFEYELNDIVDYDSKEPLRKEQINNFNKDFMSFHSGDISNNTNGADMKPLVLLSNYELDIKNRNYSGQSPERSFEQWGNIISSIKDIKYNDKIFYDDIEFIRIVDIENAGDNHDKAKATDYAYQLLEGKDYIVRIFQNSVNRDTSNKAIREIKISVDEQYITPVRDAQRAVGKYDVLTFAIRTNRRSGCRTSFIDINHSIKDAVAASIDPKIHLPIYINKSPRWTLISLGAIIIFFFVYIFPDIFADSFQLNEGIIKDISLVSITLSLFEFIKEIKDYIRK